MDTNMIQQKFKRLEREMTEVRVELAACKEQFRNSRDKVEWLEDLLTESQSRIKKLEKTKKDDTQCHCVEYSKELKSLIKRLEKTEKVCNDFNTDRAKTAKLQLALNSVMLRSQQDFETNLQGETEDSQTSIDTQAASQSDANTHVTQRLVDSSQEVFSVELDHTQRRLNGITQLNNFVKAFVPNSNFDQTRCVFRPARSGVYGLNVFVCQRGDGEMGVWLGVNGVGDYDELIGTTRGEWESVNRFLILPLVAGEEYWVKVYAMKGEPRVSRCNFSGFLISQ